MLDLQPEFRNHTALGKHLHSRHALRRLHAGWMAFARGIGVLTSSILLGAVFLLMVPWLRLLFIRRGKVLSTDLEAASFWEKAPPVPRDIAALLRQF